MLRREDREQLREILGGFALITQVGLVMVGSVLAGLFVGLWIGGFPGGVVGIIVGVAAGFFSCYRLLMGPGFGKGSGGRSKGPPGGRTDDP